MSLQFLQPYFGLGNGLQTKNVAGGAGGVGGWVELGRSTSATPSVTGLSNKRYYMILGYGDTGSTSIARLRMNNDSGTNYSYRESSQGTADGTGVSQAQLWAYQAGNPSGSDTTSFSVNYISNFSTKEKLGIGWYSGISASGAGTAPRRIEGVGKWANTTDSINRFDWQIQDGSFNATSEMVVLGWDPADTHTNNFWTELASGAGSGTSFDVTFTAKKYLWLQFYGNLSSGTGGLALRTGSGSVDTGTNYSRRIAKNFGGDGTQLSDDNINPAYPDNPNNFFLNMFIVNVSGKEKLFISHLVDQSTAGAGTAPNVYENVSKYTTTSGQIDRFRFLTAGGGTWSSTTKATIWGAD